MKKRVLTLIAAVIAIILCSALFIACSNAGILGGNGNGGNGGNTTPEHNHSYGEWYAFDEAQHIRFCNECYGRDKGDHTFQNDKCTVCEYQKGEVIPTQNGTPELKYSPSEDGLYCSCTGIGEATETDIVIASIYNCIPVTSIVDQAFYHCSGLTSITIPNSVTYVGVRAFSGCTGLTSVTIGNSVTIIDDGAFADCTGLTSITIGNKVTSIGNGAFYGCTGLTSVTISDSVTRIGDSAFYGCSRLTSVTIPDSVTRIGDSAINGERDLSKTQQKTQNKTENSLQMIV